MDKISDISKKLEKIDEQIAELSEKRKILEEDQKQRVCGKLQLIIERKHVPPERLMLLRYASKEQIDQLLNSIEEEREKPANEESIAGFFNSKKDTDKEKS